MSRFAATHSILTDAIHNRAFPGAAYGVLYQGEIIAIESAGRFTYDSDSSPVLPETVFDIASVTKVLATTAMAMHLYDHGQLDLDESVGVRLPMLVEGEPADSAKRRITARMLLAHTSGLPAYERLFERYNTAADLFSACLQMPLEAAPETRTVYSDIGFIILGHLLETLAGERVDHYCQRLIFDPLEMASTLYCPPVEMHPLIPPTGMDTFLRHRMLQGEVNDDNCFVLNGVSGHAGLFSNVADTLHFAECILDGGLSIFSAETVRLFTTRHFLPDPKSRALGWDMPSPPSSSGHFFSPSSVGHLGYTGTSLWIDLQKRLAVVLLTNRTFCDGNHKESFNRIQEVRPQFHDTILHELGVPPAR